MEIKHKLEKYHNVQIDLGTGDGNYVFKHAVKDPNTLYIGIDPIPSQMKKFIKKAKRQKLDNIVFLRGSVEKLPKEVIGTAQKVTVLYPWGTLLEKVVNADISNVISLLENEGEIEIIFGYSQDAEPSETKRLNLPILSFENIEKIYKEKGYKVVLLENNTTTETTWAKKLKKSANRDFFRLVLQV